MGVDQSLIGNALGDICHALRIADAAKEPIRADAILNLKSRLEAARDLVCRVSRGPILGTMDFVLSKKGATVIAGVGILAANLWHMYVAADGHHVSGGSVKIAISAINGDLGGIEKLFD